MNNDKALGIIRYTDAEHREEIEKNFDRCFDDLYAIIDGVRKNVDQLDGLLSRVFYGVPFGDRLHGRGTGDRLSI